MEILIALLLGGLLVVLMILWRTVQGISQTVEASRASSGDLAGAASAMRERLAELHAFVRSREQLDLTTAQSIRRLEMVIAGTHSKGVAAENLVDAVLSSLPAEWRVHDLRVGSRVVEFGLRLPNGLVLPIDSKWPATNLLEQFVASDDVTEKQRLKGQIERTVVARAREVRKYLEPGVTLGFGVAVLPDAIFDLCATAHSEAIQENVVLVSQSMLVPYLLLVFETVLKTSQSIDLEKLSTYLRDAEQSVRELQKELEGTYPHALKMLGNSRDRMAQQTARIGSRLASLRVGAGTAELPPAPGPSISDSSEVLVAVEGEDFTYDRAEGRSSVVAEPGGPLGAPQALGRLLGRRPRR